MNDLERDFAPPTDGMDPPAGIVMAGAGEVHDATVDDGADEESGQRKTTKEET